MPRQSTIEGLSTLYDQLRTAESAEGLKGADTGTLSGADREVFHNVTKAAEKIQCTFVGSFAIQVIEPHLADEPPSVGDARLRLRELGQTVQSLLEILQFHDDNVATDGTHRIPGTGRSLITYNWGQEAHNHDFQSVTGALADLERHMYPNPAQLSIEQMESALLPNVENADCYPYLIYRTHALNGADQQPYSYCMVGRENDESAATIISAGVSPEITRRRLHLECILMEAARFELTGHASQRQGEGNLSRTLRQTVNMPQVEQRVPLSGVQSFAAM